MRPPHNIGVGLSLPFPPSGIEFSVVVAVGAKYRISPVGLGVIRFPSLGIVVENADSGAVGGNCLFGDSVVTDGALTAGFVHALVALDTQWHGRGGGEPGHVGIRMAKLAGRHLRRIGFAWVVGDAIL